MPTFTIATSYETTTIPVQDKKGKERGNLAASSAGSPSTFPRRRSGPCGPLPPKGLPQAVHGGQELFVRLGELELVEQQLHGFHGVQLGERLAEEPDLLQLVLLEQELFLPCAGLFDVDGRENALVHQPAVQVDLHVTRALEFLEDHIVHPTARVHDGD